MIKGRKKKERDSGVFLTTRTMEYERYATLFSSATALEAFKLAKRQKTYYLRQVNNPNNKTAHDKRRDTIRAHLQAVEADLERAMNVLTRQAEEDQIQIEGEQTCPKKLLAVITDRLLVLCKSKNPSERKFIPDTVRRRNATLIQMERERFHLTVATQNPQKANLKSYISRLRQQRSTQCESKGFTVSMRCNLPG
eukprot:gb/GECG01003781.1/.p1 GENE.gb/GECG01003781.1/~~gb/GECG01003781.1/.p1  ORF type:complete len:195 (+),score=24.48 gb/GECG01003781.1/:1-585(+)